MKSHLVARAMAVLMLLVPAGRVSELSIAGRTPDFFFVDLFMVGGFVAAGLVFTQLPVLWRTGWRPLLALMAVVLAGGVLSPDKVAYLGSLRPLLWAVVVVILARRIRHERHARFALFAVVLGVAVIALEIMGKVGLEAFAQGGGKEDIELEWGRSNYFATFALVSIFVSYGLLKSSRYTMHKLLAATGLVLALLLLVMTKSRAAMLAALITWLVVSPALLADQRRRQQRKPRLRLRLWMLWVLVAPVIVYLAYPFVVSALGYDVNLLDSGNLRRFDAWLSAANAFVSSPVWGIGWSNSTVMLEELTETATTTHSLPLQLLAETGLIGAASVGLLLLRALKKTGPAPRLLIDRRLRNGMRLAVIAALLHCCVEPSFWGVQFVVIFWMVLTMLHVSGEAAPRRRQVLPRLAADAAVPLASPATQGAD